MRIFDGRVVVVAVLLVFPDHRHKEVTFYSSCCAQGGLDVSAIHQEGLSVG